jgi:predicted AAA+ superfamily ATPase
MYRRAINRLIDWKLRGNKKPLVFLGARQVGKTWLIKEFGRTEYRQKIEC